MAVVNIKENWSGGSAPISKDGRSASRVFTVLLDGNDSAAAAPIVARRASAGGTRIPRIGEPHPNDAWLRVANVVPAAMRSAILWEVTVNYEAPDTGKGSGDATGHDSPLDQAAQYSWGGAAMIEPVDRDANGNAIQNTAGVPFEPPLNDDTYDHVITVRRNERSMPKDAELYEGSVNAEELVVHDRRIRKGMARIFLTGEEQTSGAFTYVNVAYTIHVRAPYPKGSAYVFDGKKWNRVEQSTTDYTWYRRVANRGLQQLVYTDVTDLSARSLRQIIDDDEQPVSDPVWLDIEGLQADPEDDPIWLLFAVPGRPVRSWKPLRLS